MANGKDPNGRDPVAFDALYPDPAQAQWRPGGATVPIQHGFMRTVPSDDEFHALQISAKAVQWRALAAASPETLSVLR